MPAKFLQAIGDDNPELKRQIGCMTGIFQIFDRRHILAGRHLNSNSNNHKSHSSGHALSSRNSVGDERNGYSPQVVLGRSPMKSLSENQRISMESSRMPFSSSSCSSFSSLDCNKSIQGEHPSRDQILYIERTTKGSPKFKDHHTDAKAMSYKPLVIPHNLPIQSNCQSLNFRDVMKEDTKNHVVKHKDSPRRIQLSKSMDALDSTGFDGKSKMHVNLGESIRILVKSEQSSQYFTETNEPPRRSYEGKKTSLHPVAKVAPRLSYDGRASHLSLDSQESSKFSPKLREFHRLSLDSRECSPKSSNFDFKPNIARKQVDWNTIDHRSYMTMEHQQELGNCQRPPSIVVKLMGLEAMPSLSQDQVVLDDTIRNFCTLNTHKETNFLSEKTTTTKDDKEDLLSFSHKCYIKEPIKPHQKRSDSVIKQISVSKVPIEPAPWRHHSKIHAPEKMTSGVRKSHIKQQVESVYSEVEKRLKDLEFQQSNRDLRALKHILDAMHAKGLLENDKVEHQPSRTSIHSTSPRSDQCLGSTGAQNMVVGHPALMKGEKSPRAFQAPIVVMKPSRSFSRSGILPSPFIPLNSLSELKMLQTRLPNDRKIDALNIRICEDKAPESIDRESTNQYLQSTYRKCAQKENGTHKRCANTFHASPRLQREIRGDNGSLANSSSSLSPRLQHKQLEKGKHSRPPRPSTQFHAAPKQTANVYSSESVSPGFRLRRKPDQAQRYDDQLSDTSSGTGSLTQQVDEKSDAEVTSSNSSAELHFSSQGKKNPSRRVAKGASSTLKHKKSHISRDAVGQATAAHEKASPISVLDPSVCWDELPPERTSSNAFKDNTIQDLGICCSPNSKHDAPSPNLSSGSNQKRLSNVEDLFEKPKQQSPVPEDAPATDHVALLCENQNTDHRYVSEILLTSGLLMLDLTTRPMSMPIQLHPDLFHVLEQTKAAEENTNPEKIHLKLVFDLVNELLIQKLKIASSSPLPNKLVQARHGRLASGQRLLKELCSDIEHLKSERFTTDNHNKGDGMISCENLLWQSEDWLYSSAELQTAVLEVERCIFKDLIDEVLGEEGAFDFQEEASRKQTAWC